MSFEMFSGLMSCWKSQSISKHLVVHSIQQSVRLSASVYFVVNIFVDLLFRCMFLAHKLQILVDEQIPFYQKNISLSHDWLLIDTDSFALKLSENNVRELLHGYTLIGRLKDNKGIKFYLEPATYFQIQPNTCILNVPEASAHILKIKGARTFAGLCLV